MYKRLLFWIVHLCLGIFFFFVFIEVMASVYYMYNKPNLHVRSVLFSPFITKSKIENAVQYKMLFHNRIPYNISLGRTRPGIYKLTSEDTGRDYQVTINSRGFRGREFSDKKNRLRIICFGGSSTIGMSVADNKTWPSQLENYFQSAGMDVEVLNFSCGSKSLSWIYDLYMNEAYKYKPDIIIIYSNRNTLMYDATAYRSDIIRSPFEFFLYSSDRWFYYNIMFYRFFKDRHMSSLKKKSGMDITEGYFGSFLCRLKMTLQIFKDRYLSLNRKENRGPPLTDSLNLNLSTSTSQVGATVYYDEVSLKELVPTWFNGWFVREELVANGELNSNTKGWDGAAASIASVNRGQSGNCMRVTNNSTEWGSAIKSISITSGKFYKLSLYAKNGSSKPHLYTFNHNIPVMTGIKDSPGWKYHGKLFRAVAKRQANKIEFKTLGVKCDLDYLMESFPKILSSLISIASSRGTKVVLVKQALWIDPKLQMEWDKNSFPNVEQLIQYFIDPKWTIEPGTNSPFSSQPTYAKWLLIGSTILHRHMENIVTSKTEEAMLVNPLPNFLNETVTVNKKDFFLDYMHLKPKGNKILAEVIYKAIQREMEKDPTFFRR